MTTPETAARRTAVILSWCFLVSGVAGLIYEVAWNKYLILFLGNMTYAHTIVLATFMGGLALGNALFGPLADRTPSRLHYYGWMEVGIGIYGFLFPWLLDAAAGTYLGAARELENPALVVAGKMLLSLALLLIPTVLMGGTMPLLSRFFTERVEHVGVTVGWLYTVNSLGGAFGSVLAGFYLLQTFGLALTVNVAAALNVLVGLAALSQRPVERWQGERRAAREEEAPAPAASPRVVRLALLGVALSGMVALFYEIAWIRLLSLVLGSSTYSFSVMLAAFITGITLGSLWVSRLLRRPRNLPRLFALLELGVGVSILLTLPIYERLPYLFLKIAFLFSRTPQTFYLFEGLKYALCVALMLVPTVLLGATLPVVSRLATEQLGVLGRRVGSVFALNTLGTVVGAALAGLLLMPWLGMKGLIELGIAINLLIGAGMLLGARQRLWTHALSAAGVALFLAFRVGYPAWDKAVLSRGDFRQRHAIDIASFDDYKRLSTTTVTYYKDGVNATVTAGRNAEGHLYLKVNGKPDASTGADMPTQLLLGHLPSLLAPAPRDALIVGLGSGITAGAVLTHPLASVDVVEISAAVVEASRLFAPYNHNALEQPRLKLILDDAKTYLQRTGKRYDVIISEPSNPWIAGIGNLFSIEFYQAARAALRPDGLFVQWFHVYEMDNATLKLVLRTFARIFPHLSIWQMNATDILLLGGVEPLALDLGRLAARLELAPVQEDLRRIGISRPATLLSLQIITEAKAARLAGEGRLNEDYFPILEYEAPKVFYLNRTADLVRVEDERLHLPPAEGLRLRQWVATQPLLADDFAEMAAYQREHDGKGAFLLPLLRAWLERYPDDSRAAYEMAQLNLARGALHEARLGLRTLLEGEPDSVRYLSAYARVLIEELKEQQSVLAPGDSRAILEILQRCRELAPQEEDRYLHLMGDLLAMRGQYAEALRPLMAALEFKRRNNGGSASPSLETVLMKIALLHRRLNHDALTARFAREVLQLNPANAEARFLLQQVGFDRAS